MAELIVFPLPNIKTLLNHFCVTIQEKCIGYLFRVETLKQEVNSLPRVVYCFVMVRNYSNETSVKSIKYLQKSDLR